MRNIMSKEQSFTQKRKQKKLGKELKSNTLIDAYDKMFSMIEFVIQKQGCIENQILGLDVINGSITGVNAYYVKDSEIDLVPVIIEDMLTKYPMLVQIFEAWSAPDFEGRPSGHPQKQDIIQVLIYTESSIYTATCPRDLETKSITKGELIKPDQVSGRLVRHEPTKH